MAGTSYVGLDVGGTYFKAARVGAGGQVERRHREEVAREGGDQLLHQVETIVATVSEGEPIAAVGIGVPGIVRQPSGRLRGVPNLPSLASLRERDLAGEISQRLGRPAFVENDANAAALAEAWRGAGRDSQSVLYVTLGTGVGGALILGGRLWSGASGYAGEIGHVSIDPHGAQCGCGALGCLETVVGIAGWVRRASAALSRRSSALAGQTLEPESIVAAAREGDAVAIEIVDETAAALGLALGGALNLLNVERVVIGGGVAAAGAFLLDKVTAQTRLHCWSDVFGDCSFRLAELAGDAGVVGAARVAMLGAQER